MNEDILFDLSDVVRKLTVRIRRSLQLAIENSRLNLSVQEAHVLVLLQEHGLCIPKDLACHSGYDKATITRVVNQLCKKGYALRHPGSLDKRNTGLSLTAEGSEVCIRLYEARLAAHQAVFSSLSVQEIQLVKNILIKCI